MTRSPFRVPWRPTVPRYLTQVEAGRYALIIVDMQNYWANPQRGVCAELAAAGDRSATRYFVRQLGQITAKLRILAQTSRSAGGHVVYTRVRSFMRNGSDMSVYYRALGVRVPVGSHDANIVAPLRPSSRDIIISKPGSGAFFGTALDPSLRNLGVELLVIGGVMTDGCVESTVREAADRSFRIVVASDACATWSEQTHHFSLRSMGTRYADIRTTAEIVTVLKRLVRQRLPASSSTPTAKWD